MTGDDGQPERLAALEARVDELEATMATVTNRDLPLLKGTMRSVVGTEIETLDDLVGAGRQFQEDWAAREERLRAFESRLEALGTADANTSKAAKYQAVLAFAQNKHSGTSKVAVSPAEIKGCTGVSRRYAYDLLEAMAADIDGVRMREATQVNTGSGVQRKGKALLVDCEAVHGESAAVSQFTTDGGDNGGR